MPYDPDNPPEKLRNLDAKKQRQWVHVYNSMRKRGHDEKTAHQGAWSVVKGTEIGGELYLISLEVKQMMDDEEIIKKAIGEGVKITPQDAQKVSFSVKGEASRVIPKMLSYLQNCGQIGHSVTIECEDQKWGFDGDGSDMISDIRVNGVQYKGD